MSGSDTFSTVHVTPDAGVAVFAHPFPKDDAEVQQIQGRWRVQVTAVDGPWAQVKVDEAIVGWVEGALLVPPVVPAREVRAEPQVAPAPIPKTPPRVDPPVVAVTPQAKSARGTHRTPKGGMRVFPEPYPRFVGEYHEANSVAEGREVVVTDLRGHWAQVSEDGVVVGWVDARRLIPPVSVVARPATPRIPVAPQRIRVSLTSGAVLGILSSIGVGIGAAMSWAHVLLHTASSFDVAIAFLFDKRTTAHGPNIGAALIVLAVVGALVSLFSTRGIWRFAVGALVAAIVVLYCVQLANLLTGTRTSLGAVIGAGPWVTGISAALLMISAAMGRSTRR